MARAYVEFVQSQWLPWEPAPEVFGGAEWKRLSHDPDGGACSVLLRWRAGRARLAPALGADWELFVLRGVLQLGKLPVLGTHFYAYLPAGLPLGSAAAGHAATDLPPGGEGPGDGSAIALAFFSRAPLAADAGKPDLSRLVGPIDTTKLRWDNAGIDPNINHLNAARKNLRFAPEGDCRSYLLGGMPQGYPYGGAAMERHPHVEEFFLVSGDMASHLGVMRAGGYFHRPPGIAHGRDCTRSGYLLFCRTPGANRTTTDWTPETYEVTWNPPHRPVIPAGLGAVGARPLADPVEY
jgi:hypothetical protein